MIINKLSQLIFVLSFFLITLTNKLLAEINVATAANMKGTIAILVKEFNKVHPNIKINISSASSGELFQQINNGAPIHLFISADTFFPYKLQENNLTQSPPVIYACGQLVIAITNKNITITKLTDILHNEIKHIAIANPRLAPYGQVAVKLLKQQKLYSAVASKLVYGNSLNDVNELMFSNSVDIAFTNKSALVLDKNIKYYAIPINYYPPIKQAMVLIKNNNALTLQEATLFYNFIKSTPGQTILANSGYIVK